MTAIHDTFTKILKEELVMALGCTEPIALALAGAKCREVLGTEPEMIVVNVSGNIIKNVQGVIIPGTKDLKGTEFSVLLGVAVGKPERKLEILDGLTEADIQKAKTMKAAGLCQVNHAKDKPKLYMDILMKKGAQTARVEVMHQHTNITSIQKNGHNIVYNPCQEEDFNATLTDRSRLSIEHIVEFADSVAVEKIRPILKEQIDHNLRVAREGLEGGYGLNSGQILLKEAGDSLKEKMKAYGAGGSDARMSGCDLPVVINSGSGNQGLTIANPVYVYCEAMGIDEERLYRALALANLVPIHLKTRIGRLSAFCGAVTASVGVGAALTYLAGGTVKQVKDTIKNSLADLTGVICDGAKPSCAIKIASAIDGAYMAHQLAMKGMVVEDGTGIIDGDVEGTIKNMAVIAHDAMAETDAMILKIMAGALKVKG